MQPETLNLLFPLVFRLPFRPQQRQPEKSLPLLFLALAGISGRKRMAGNGIACGSKTLSEVVKHCGLNKITGSLKSKFGFSGCLLTPNAA